MPTNAGPPECYRCRQPGAVEYFDIRTFSGSTYRLEHGECTTPGCQDPDGSRRLEPPEPEELKRRAEATWLRMQRALCTPELQYPLPPR